MRIQLTVLLVATTTLSLAQERLWRVTLSDHTTTDSLVLSTVDRDSLYVTKRGALLGLPLADIIELRKPKHVNLASYVLIGAFSGIPIGFIARATDASARVTEVSPLPYVAEGALIGTTGGLLIAWLSSQDEAYSFSTGNRMTKSLLLRDVIAGDHETTVEAQREDSIAVQEEMNPLHHWITIDYGTGPFNYPGHGWQPLSSFRIGYGYGASQNLTFCGHLDFYENGLAKESGMYSGLRPSSARRYDVALYGGWILLKIVEVGAGFYFRTSDQVYNYYFSNSFPPTPWGPSGTSEFRFFYVVGIGYQLTIMDGVMIPFGLSFRNSADGDNGSPVIFRIGLGYRF